MAKLPTSLQETAITHSIRGFECGKEFDLRKLLPDCPVSGIRFVPTEDKVRALARLTFESKKISKSLGTYSHLEFDKLTKTTKHAKRHFWLTDVCTCHGLLPSHSA
jgi:hypothetical protein